MHTLPHTDLKNAIHSWPKMKEVINTLTDSFCPFPREIEGLKGGLSGFFIAEYLSRSPRDMVIIVPNEKDAQELTLDIQGALETPDGSCYADILQLPWWGMVPYRPVAKGSLVFGERASVFRKLPTSRKRNSPEGYKGACF